MARCAHCGQDLPRELAEAYCCHGCRTAHALIEQFELKRFYEIVQENRESIAPAGLQRRDYGLFDHPSFQKDFVEDTAAGEQRAHFYLGNMTCYACVWVCETMTRRIDPAAQLAINLSTGEAHLRFDSKRHVLSDFLKNFESLGYAVSPNRQYQSDARSDVLRIGVSLFCLMNIMMLALPEYLSPETLSLEFRDLFRWISLGLASVSVFYGAWPLLRGAVQALRNWQLHLDLPIGLGVLVAFLYSSWHTFLGLEDVYFDTTAAVVALLLIGRFIQKQALQRIHREQNQWAEGDFRFARVQAVSGSEELKALTSITRGERLRLLPGEVVPLEGELLDAKAEMHLGWLTGESQLRGVKRGETVPAGAVNGSGPMHLLAKQDGAESYLLRLEESAQALQQDKGRALELSERLARAFVVLVLLVAGLVFFYWWPRDPSTAITRFVAVLLVACPCIFGFGAPLVIARAFQWGLRRSVLFRSQAALEGLSQVRDYYFDKTGTLTEDESQVQDPRWHEAALARVGWSRDDILSLLRVLPDLAEHHVLRALASWSGPPSQVLPPEAIKGLRVYWGQGISLVWREREIRIGRAPFCCTAGLQEGVPAAASALSIDGALILDFKLEEKLRPEAQALIARLLQAGKKCWILSGDGEAKVLRIGRTLGLAPEHLLAQLTPEGKSQRIAHGARAAMVGNGINDTLAASKVGIGIATQDASSALREAADIALTAPGLAPLASALAISKAARGAMLRCFGFALGFNLLGLSLAVTGTVTPVIAAVLMPISSLTIFTLARRWTPAAEV